MIFDIRKPLPDQIDGYRIDLRYITVLNAFEIMHNSDLMDAEKMAFVSAMLFPGKRTPPIETVKLLFERYISTGKRGGGKTKSFDFLQDGIYIYSSFLMDYGVDLFSCPDLHWMRFISMFHGLSDRTKMREVMAIRQRKIPEQTSHNADQIAALMEAKAYYALEVSQEEREQNFRDSLSKLAAALKARAR